MIPDDDYVIFSGGNGDLELWSAVEEDLLDFWADFFGVFDW